MAPKSLATQERIYDAAEELFCERGFPKVSLRQITKKAGVNLAAVNYHFGTKEDLYRQVLLRRVRPINGERMNLLTQAEQLAGDQPVPLRALLESLIRPLLRRAANPMFGGASFLRLIGRDLIEPQPFMREELAREFDPLLARYTRALTQALPALPPSEIFLRIQFSFGSVLYAAALQHDFERLSNGVLDGKDLDGCIRRLVDFCAAGLGAPVAGC